MLFTVKKLVVFDKTVFLNSKSRLSSSFHFHNWKIFQLKTTYNYSQKKKFNLYLISHSAFITFGAKQNEKITISIQELEDWEFILEVVIHFKKKVGGKYCDLSESSLFLV